MEGKNYTVIELAEQIGVPRTTINDWLARYSQYIDSVAQGKRKVYPDSALNVLKEVAAMRNSGKSFTEIEKELSAKHPIHAVPVPPQEEEKKAPAANEETAGKTASENPQQTGHEGFAVIARQQSEEIGRLIGESFRNMDQRIQELEKLSSAQRRMSYFWLAACFLFLILLAGGSFLAWHFLDKAKQENTRLMHQQTENTQTITALKEQSVSLIAGNKNFQANIAKLESELKQQKKEFDQNMKTEKQRLTELHKAQEKALLSERDQARIKVREQEARLSLEKEKFAAERLKLLQEMEALKKQHEALKAEQEKMKAAAKPVPESTQTPSDPAKKSVLPGTLPGQENGKPDVKPLPPKEIHTLPAVDENLRKNTASVR